MPHARTAGEEAEYLMKNGGRKVKLRWSLSHAAGRAHVCKMLEEAYLLLRGILFCARVEASLNKKRMSEKGVEHLQPIRL